MKNALVLLPFAIVCASSAIDAQVVVNGSQTPPLAYTWRIDVTTGERTILFPGTYSAIGIDDANGRVYLTQSAMTLYEWDYGSPLTPHAIGVVKKSNGQIVPCDGLAFGGGQLFGSAQNQGLAQGIYRIDTTTFVATPIVLTPAPLVFPDALAFNPADGLFYGVLDGWVSAQPGLYSYDLLGSGAVTQAAPYPSGGPPDCDGLAIGNGRAYLIGDEGFPMAIWDFASQSYSTQTLNCGFTNQSFDCGGDWAPSLNVQSQPQVYCEGKRNSAYCIPLIAWNGDASASGASPFQVQGLSMRPNTKCGLFYSVTGAASAPFGGGTLCLAAPLRHAVTLTTTSTNQQYCPGVATFDFNAFIASGANPALVVGQTVWMQFISRDPGFAQPNNVGLSPAMRAVIKP